MSRTYKSTGGPRTNKTNCENGLVIARRRALTSSANITLIFIRFFQCYSRSTARRSLLRRCGRPHSVMLKDLRKWSRQIYTPHNSIAMIPLTLCCILAGIIKPALSLSSLKLQGPPTLPHDASHPLNPALASFSIETAFFEEFFGNVSVPNQLSLNLLENIKSRTGVPPEIRIGGITADSTHWDPNQKVALSNFIDSTGALHNTTLGPQFWKSVGLLPQGTKIIMTLVTQSHKSSYDYTNACFTGLA